MRKKVAEFSILHGIHAAAEKFGVSAPSVTNWRKAYGITRETKKAAKTGRRVKLATPTRSTGSAGRTGYPEEFRREVADFSILHGIQQAAQRFNVSAPSVTNWRRAFGITRAHKREALASVTRTASGTRRGPAGGGVSLPKGELRQVRKQLDQAFRALDRLLAKLG
jgi:transposase